MPRGVSFNPSGTRMYIAAVDKIQIYQYDLASAFDISSATFNGKSLNVVTEDSSPQAARFNADGSKLFLLGRKNMRLYEYNLAIPYDISTANYSSISLDISNEEDDPLDYTFSYNGTMIFVIGNENDAVQGYVLEEPFAISTAASTSSFSVRSQSSFHTSLTFDPSGTQLYTLGAASSADRIYNYDLEDDAFFEISDNFGHIEGSINLSVIGDEFSEPNAILVSPDHFESINLPKGLIPQIRIDATAKIGQLFLNGRAIEHDSVHSVEELIFTFRDNVFKGKDTSRIENASGLSNSRLGIKFLKNPPMPDLTIKSVLFEEQVIIGTCTSFIFEIENLGELEADSSETIIYVSSDSVLNSVEDLVLANLLTPIIPGKETIRDTLNLNIPSDTEMGEFWFFVVADGLDKIVELEEENNVTSVKVLLKERPEAPEISDVSLSKKSLMLGSRDSVDLTFRVTDGNSNLSQILIKYGSASFDLPQKELVLETTGEGGFFKVNFDESDFDNLGLQYQILATDESGLTARFNNGLITSTFSNSITSQFNLEVSQRIGIGDTDLDYQMLAVPFEDLSVTDLSLGTRVDTVVNGSNDGVTVTENWKIVAWENGFVEVLENESLQVGKGYWTLSSGIPSISFDGKSSIDSRAFEISLNSEDGGFNLIGNPYLFDIDWQEVISYNVNNNIISANEIHPQLYIYTDGRYTNTTILSRFQGAFARSFGANSLVIPATAIVKSSVSKVSASRTDISPDDWDLNLILKATDYVNTLGGIGMNKYAKEGLDFLDLPRLPRLSRFLDLTSCKQEVNLSLDIVPTSDYYVWVFSLGSSSDLKQADLSWSNQLLSGLENEMLLVLPRNSQIIDMKRQRTVTLRNGDSFQIYYGSLDQILSNIDQRFTTFELVYPNPATSELSAQILLAGYDTEAKVTMNLLDLNGKILQKIWVGFFSNGYHNFELDVPDVIAGQYFIELSINDEIAKGWRKRILFH